MIASSCTDLQSDYRFVRGMVIFPRPSHMAEQSAKDWDGDASRRRPTSLRRRRRSWLPSGRQRAGGARWWSGLAAEEGRVEGGRVAAAEQAGRAAAFAGGTAVGRLDETGGRGRLAVEVAGVQG